MTKINDEQNKKLAGYVVKYDTNNQLYGWVFAPINSIKVKVIAKYKENSIGVGYADIVRDSTNVVRKKLGFVLKVCETLNEESVRSELLNVYAEINGEQVQLTKTNKLSLVGSSRSVIANEPLVNASLVKDEYTQVQVAVGTISDDGVAIVGRDGFLFLVGGSNNVAEMYKDNGDRVSDKWLDLVRERNSALSHRGIAFLQIFIPEKSSVFPDLYPIEINGTSEVYNNIRKKCLNDDELVEKCVFLDIYMNKRKDKLSLYRRTDSHLTSSGAKYLFDLQLAHLAKTPNYIISGTYSITDAWDLGEKFKPLMVYENVEFYKEIVVSDKVMTPMIVEEILPENGHIGTRIIYRNNDAPIQKCIVIFANSFYWGGGTSLGQCWWFSRLFAEFHFLWNPSVDYDYIDHVKPDVVICQTIERFLRRIAKH